MKIKTVVVCFLVFILSLAGLNSSANQGNNFINVNNGYGFEQNIEIGYPAVDELEKKVFGSVSSGQNIYSRLNRLETAVFGKTSNAHLSERVDRLDKLVLSGRRYSTGSSNFNNSNSNIIFGQDYREYGNFSNTSPAEYSIVLYDLEKQFLETAYPSESVNIRVKRLENHLFSDSLDGYPIEDRIQRLTAYADARESDEFYEDQAQIKKYNNVMRGANAISLLFMILQFLL